MLYKPCRVLSKTTVIHLNLQCTLLVIGVLWWTSTSQKVNTFKKNYNACRHLVLFMVDVVGQHQPVENAVCRRSTLSMSKIAVLFIMPHHDFCNWFFYLWPGVLKTVFRSIQPPSCWDPWPRDLHNRGCWKKDPL